MFDGILPAFFFLETIHAVEDTHLIQAQTDDHFNAVKDAARVRFAGQFQIAGQPGVERVPFKPLLEVREVPFQEERRYRVVSP